MTQIVLCYLLYEYTSCLLLNLWHITKNEQIHIIVLVHITLINNIFTSFRYYIAMLTLPCDGQNLRLRCVSDTEEHLPHTSSLNWHKNNKNLQTARGD